MLDMMRFARTLSLAMVTLISLPALSYDGYYGSGVPWLSISAQKVWFQIKDYGDNLLCNKSALLAAIKRSGANQQEEVLLMAVAMQETRDMYIGEHDSKKDGSKDQNYSILNLNYHMLMSVDAALGTGSNKIPSDYVDLNDPGKLAQACWYMVAAFRIWGIAGTLNFHRGGSSALKDSASYNAEEYRNAMYTIYDQIATDMNLMWDSRRIEVNVSYQ